MYSRIKGRQGEEQAKSYLQNQGYKILAQNYTIRGGEIDIVAQKDSIIVIVEVKSRKAAIPEYTLSITKNKKQSLYKTALHFLSAHKYQISDFIIRFDVIFIIDNNIQHIPKAFDANF